MSEKSADYRWVEQVIMAGLRQIGESRDGERLETFGDLFDEHDKVMGLLRVVNFEYEEAAQ